jgi:hypothetical protein
VAQSGRVVQLSRSGVTGADRSGRDGTVQGLEHVDEVRAARDVLRLRLRLHVEAMLLTRRREMEN